MCEFCPVSIESACCVCGFNTRSPIQAATTTPAGASPENTSTIRELIRDAIGTTDPVSLLSIVGRIERETKPGMPVIVLPYPGVRFKAESYAGRWFVGKSLQPGNWTDWHNGELRVSEMVLTLKQMVTEHRETLVDVYGQP